jgi:hypothetical protein
MLTPTVYCLSTCTSLKCTTWKGVFPVEVKFLGLVGAGLGKGTEYAFTAGGWHSPNTASQSFVEAWPKGDMDLKSRARIGACWPTAPSHTSSSSTYNIHGSKCKSWRGMGRLTFRALQTATRVFVNAESPRTARPFKGTSRAWQPAQLTADGRASTISSTRLPATHVQNMTSGSNTLAASNIMFS